MSNVYTRKSIDKQLSIPRSSAYLTQLIEQHGPLSPFPKSMFDHATFNNDHVKLLLKPFVDTIGGYKPAWNIGKLSTSRHIDSKDVRVLARCSGLFARGYLVINDVVEDEPLIEIINKYGNPAYGSHAFDLLIEICTYRKSISEKVCNVLLGLNVHSVNRLLAEHADVPSEIQNKLLKPDDIEIVFSLALNIHLSKSTANKIVNGYIKHDGCEDSERVILALIDTNYHLLNGSNVELITNFKSSTLRASIARFLVLIK